MARKTHDLAVKTGNYTDNQGNQKNRYENVGALMQGDNGPFIMLKRTFNPAGAPTDRDTVLISAFEPRSRDGSQSGGQNNQPDPYGAPSNQPDDEIPW